MLQPGSGLRALDSGLATGREWHCRLMIEDCRLGVGGANRRGIHGTSAATGLDLPPPCVDGLARFLHCYPEEPPRHSSFFKFLNLKNLVSFSQMLNFAAIEEMDDESPNLVHILAAMDSGSVMSIAGVPDSVDAEPGRSQNAPDFSGEVLQFGCGEGHAKEHVRIARIEMVV